MHFFEQRGNFVDFLMKILTCFKVFLIRTFTN